MDVIEMARKLGEALKNSEEYKNYENAKAELKADVELGTKINEYKVQRSLYETESNKEEKDDMLLDALDSRCEVLYKEITSQPLMQKYNKAEEDFEMLVTAVNMTIASYIGSNSYSSEGTEGEGHEGCSGSCAHCHGCK